MRPLRLRAGRAGAPVAQGWSRRTQRRHFWVPMPRPTEMSLAPSLMSQTFPGPAGLSRRGPSKGNADRIYNGGMDGVPSDRDLTAIGLLQDPVRRALYGHVVAAGGEVSRNQAAEAAGVARGLAAFHLDRLVEAGLLDGLGEPAGRAVMDPGPGRCCVAITSKDNQD